MKQLNEYLSTKIKPSDLYGEWKDNFDLNFPDDKKPRWDKKGKAYLWWKFWVILKNNGPMSKKEILRKLGLKETSYSTVFAQLSAMNIIVPIKKTKNLEANDPSEWKFKKVFVETDPKFPYGHWTYE